MIPAAGAVIAERFELEGLAGRGASGAVYRAHDRRGGAPVALKILDASAPSGRARFEAEAALLAGLAHPAIAAYLGHGVDAHGRGWLAMEWLEGETLAARLARGPLAVHDAVALARRIAGGLAAAHRLGAVHRDLKPANLFLPGGAVDAARILDFGVALWAGAKLSTADGVVIGTPGYMSPEQARGAPELDARADVFALGCVLFEALAGRPAFRAPHPMAVLAKVVFEEVPPLRALRADTPPALEALVAGALEKDPTRRPADGDALLDLLADPAGLDAGGPPDPTPFARERRLVSVFVARAPGRVDLGPLRAHEGSGALDLAQLADGTIVGTVRPTSAATDLAGLAAAHARRLSEALGGRRVALCTGRAELSGGAPVGEVIDRASALAREAGDGGVIADDTTRALLEGRWTIEGPRLIAPRRADGARRLLGRRTPMVGRGRELAILEGLFEEAEEESLPVVALVTGAPGAGKSRLRRELVERLRARDGPPRVDVARAELERAGSSLELVRQLLRQVLEAPETVAPAEGRARLATHLGDPTAVDFLAEIAGWGPSDADAPAHVLAARHDRVLMHDQQERAWIAWLRARAREPLVIVLEDLQWGDAPSVRLLEAAVRALQDAPLVILGFARPDGALDRPFAPCRPVELALGPLSDHAARELVEGVLGAGADDATIAALIERAEGNAFHLEELIRAVAEGGAPDAFPDSVLAMAQARLERLAPEERSLLRAASVMGRAIWPDALVALLGVPRDALDGRIDALVEGELLEPSSRSRVEGEPELRFRHDLVREASYATLAELDRPAAHARAAAWLEARGLDEPVALARHLALAGAPARAAATWLRAAATALAADDFGAALERARAAAAAEDPAVRGRARLVAAEAHRWRGEHAAAASAAEEAAALLAPGTAEWFSASREALMAHGRGGAYDGVRERSTAALAIEPVDDGARVARIVLCVAAGRQLFHAGRYDAADEVLQATLHLCPDPDRLEPSIAAQVHGLTAAAARHRGDLAGDLEGYARTLAAFERASDAKNAVNCRVSLAFAHAELGAFERARAELDRALEDAERLGLAGVATRARQNLGLALSGLGEHARAGAILDRVIEESRAQGNPRFEGWTTIYRAQVALAAGAPEEAARLADRAAALLAVSRPARAGALAIGARARVALGRVEEARAGADEAMATLEALGGIEEFESLVRLAHAERALAAGEGPRAIAAAASVLRARAEALRGEHREGFLYRVPENRRTLELAEAHT